MATTEDDPQPMLAGFIRAQRQMANLSLPQLSAMAMVSNPCLSQIERGLHQLSARLLKSIADALQVSAQMLFEQAEAMAAAEPRSASSDNSDSDSTNVLPTKHFRDEIDMIRMPA
jgi:transcriptional regulator with XRE-family HTH domain